MDEQGSILVDFPIYLLLPTLSENLLEILRIRIAEVDSVEAESGSGFVSVTGRWHVADVPMAGGNGRSVNGDVLECVNLVGQADWFGCCACADSQTRAEGGATTNTQIMRAGWIR